MDGDWMLTREAAALGGVTDARIRQLIADGKFPGARRLGPEYRGVWVLPRDQVVVWANSERKRGRLPKPKTAE